MSRSLPPPWQDVGRVLAVRLDNVGDVVMLGPALRALRAALPDANLTLLASPAGAQVAPLLADVDDVVVTRAVWQDASSSMPLDPRRELALVRQLAGGRFDAAVIFTSFSQSPWPPAYACYLARIPVRVGQSKEFGGSLLTHWVRAAPDECHQVDRNLHLLEHTELPLAGRDLALRVPAAADARARALLAEAGLAPGEPFVALAPGASCPARRWFPERFAQVAVELSGHLPVVVLAGAREHALVEPVVAAAAGRPVTSLAGRTSVAELAAVIASARLVVANDSGPMHVADAFARPMVVLYSGTELESQWEPRRAPARLLRRPTPCAPCHRFECPYGLPCLDVGADEVVRHALELLQSTEELCARSAS